METQGLFLTSPGRYAPHPGPHSKVRERERERGLRADLKLCFFGGSRVGNLGFFRLLFIDRFKIREQGLGCQKGKTE